MADAALDGIRVLDLCEGVFGYCGKLLADYGARVVKVERPGAGDAARRMWPFKDDDPDPEKSGLFLYLNSNKLGVTMDLESEEGRGLFRALVKDADCVLESYPPGTLDALGLGFGELERINSRIVLTSVTPFGQAGPYRDYKGPDLVIQALQGSLGGWGRADREPLKTPSYVTEFFTGAGAAMATLGAFWHAEETGEGQRVDVGSLEAQTLVSGPGLMRYVYTGMVPPRAAAPFPGVMKCKDGFIGVNLLTQWHWESFCRLLGKEELLEREEYASPPMRALHAQELYEVFQPILLEHTSDELFHRAAGELQLPLAPVPRVDELPDLEQHRARGFFREVAHPVIGPTLMPGPPFALPESPWELRRPAPLLGQHNRDVYGALGYSDEGLADLARRGVI